MSFLGFLVLLAIVIGLYCGLVLPRLRPLAWPSVGRLWAALKSVFAWLRVLCGNSRTIAYAAELLGSSTRRRCWTGRSFSAPRRPAA
jgi:hypothetical protein